MFELSNFVNCVQQHNTKTLISFENSTLLTLISKKLIIVLHIKIIYFNYKFPRLVSKKFILTLIQNYFCISIKLILLIYFIRVKQVLGFHSLWVNFFWWVNNIKDVTTVYFFSEVKKIIFIFLMCYIVHTEDLKDVILSTFAIRKCISV